MERNREARRGSMVAVNGGGLSRRRQRNGSLRDSPEEDGAVEFSETSRLRDRTSKRDRERDRSSRSKRRRGDRLIHGGGGGRDDGEDSSDESVDDEEDDEEDDQSVSLRTSSHPPPTMNQPTSSSASQQNSHSRRNIPLARPVRPPPVWKVADEMIGVQIPRKARSASGKRSQESLVSSSNCGGGEQIHHQPSTSPGRPSSTSTAHNSPSSSSASVKKKLLIGGGSHQQRPPKAASKSQSQDKIEIDVAEVLFKMARQFECNSPKQDNHKLESKDANRSLNNEVKSPASSPISQPSSNALSNQGTSAPKRKRPRVIKYDEDKAAALPSSSAKKMEPTEQTVKSEASSPKLDKLADSCKCAPDPLSSHAAGAAASSLADAENDSGVKRENDPKPDLGGGDQTESSEVPRPDLDVKFGESDNKFESEPPAEKPPAKLIIDLMEPPPGKSSPDREDRANVINKSSGPQIELAQKMGDSGRDGEKIEPKRNQEEMLLGEGKKLEPMTEIIDVKKQKKKGLDLQLDLEKPSKEILPTSKDQSQKQQQPKASTKSESKSDKPVSPAVSMPFPLPVSGWPGNLNPFGYMGQASSLPPVPPVDERSGSSKSLIPPQRPKRCATHCYIAKSINYYQQLTKMNAFWPAAAGTMQFYGAKPYNLNAVPPESAINNSLQGNLQGRSLSAMPDKVSNSVGNGYMAPSAGDKTSATGNSVAEAPRKQLMLQQIPQPGSANTMFHGPAFIFPLNQHTAGAAAASTRPAAPKSAAGSSSASSANIGAANTASGGGSAAAVNFNFTSLPPNEAQYLAILQNNGYPFPIPAHVSPYRGASPALAMPFFSGSFYSSQMIHPSQLQQQPVGQQAHHAQQGHQNTSTSSGSSSSQKLQQKSKRVPGVGGSSVTGGSSNGLPSSKQHHHTAEVNQDSPLVNDARSSQAHKNIYGHNFAMPIHPQNFAVISPTAGASALGGASGSQNEKQQAPQTFAMSYASLAGATGVAAPAPPGLDFSTMSPSHPLFHSLPEAARHGYHFSAAAAAAAPQTAYQKKTNHHEDGKSMGEMVSASIAGEDERKAMAASKGPASGLQNSLTFSRPDGEASMSSIINTSIMDSSSRTLNLIQAASSGGRVPNRSLNGVPTTSSSNTIANSPGVQQQQQIIQLQKQQQQQLQMQHQLTSHPKSSERLPGGSSTTKFLPGFPQALIQGGGSPSQSPQWKSSSRLNATPLPSPSPVSSSNKSQVPQQPSRVSQPNQPAPSHQTQISFGGNALKMAVGSIGRQSTLPSLSSPTSVVVGSLPNTVSKGANIGSPQVSSSVKSAASAPTSLSSLPQASDRNSPSNSSLKLSSVSNRNMPSILGQPHITSVPTSSSSSNTKQQQPQTQQKQPYPQPQLFFSGAYMPSQTSQANAIAYYQRQQAELQSQQHNSNPTSMGVLSVCSAATHPGIDASKRMAAAGSLKGLPAHGLLQHPGQAASGTPYPLITAAAAAGFPYISSMQSVTVKPPDQKPAAGNNTLNAPWQPEKR